MPEDLLDHLMAQVENGAWDKIRDRGRAEAVKNSS
jgi:hypothetical protein